MPNSVPFQFEGRFTRNPAFGDGVAFCTIEIIAGTNAHLIGTKWETVAFDNTPAVYEPFREGSINKGTVTTIVGHVKEDEKPAKIYLDMLPALEASPVSTSQGVNLVEELLRTYAAPGALLSDEDRRLISYGAKHGAEITAEHLKDEANRSVLVECMRNGLAVQALGKLIIRSVPPDDNSMPTKF